MSKPRSSSGSWRNRQERDPYVQRARRDGWRSRAVYKLEQIDEKDKILRPDMVCVDLGSAPGSWSQYVTAKLKGRVRIVAALAILEEAHSVIAGQAKSTIPEVPDSLKHQIVEKKSDILI